jgi:cytidylate kinase
MNLPTSPERLTEALVQAHHHWIARREAGSAGPVPSSFTITLSREAGAQGAAVAQALGAKLGWPVYDRELLRRIADEMGLRTGLLESLDEKRTGWLLEAVQAFSSEHVVGEGSFFRHLLETVLSLGSHGSCVIVGRGAGQILPAATTLRVRLVAPREERIAATARHLGLSREEAVRHVTHTDRERAQFVKDHFHTDAADPVHYDLILNSARFTTEECAELILEALRRLQTRSARAVPATRSAAR